LIFDWKDNKSLFFEGVVEDLFAYLFQNRQPMHLSPAVQSLVEEQLADLMKG
jgi:hypothetical protein